MTKKRLHGEFVEDIYTDIVNNYDHIVVPKGIDLDEFAEQVLRFINMENSHELDVTFTNPKELKLILNIADAHYKKMKKMGVYPVKRRNYEMALSR